MNKRFRNVAIGIIAVLLMSYSAVPAAAVEVAPRFFSCIDRWDAPVYPPLAINGNLDGKFKLMIVVGATGELHEVKPVELTQRWLLFKKSIVDSLTSFRAKPECFGVTLSLAIHFQLYPEGDFRKIQPSLTILNPDEMIVRAMRRPIIAD